MQHCLLSLVDSVCAYRANEVKGSGDTVVGVHPGLIQTSLARDWVYNESPVRAFRGLADAMFHYTFLPPSYAVDTVMHAITAPRKEVSCSHAVWLPLSLFDLLHGLH